MLLWQLNLGGAAAVVGTGIPDVTIQVRPEATMITVRPDGTTIQVRPDIADIEVR